MAKAKKTADDEVKAEKKAASAKKTAKTTAKKASASTKAPAPAKPAEEKKAAAKATAKKATSKKATAKAEAPAGAAKAPASKAAESKTSATKATAAKTASTKGPAKKPTENKAAPAKPAPAKPAPAKKSAPKAVSTGNGISAPPAAREAFRSLEEHERELPLEYNDTKVVLLVRDPEWIFAYWELSDEVRRKYDLPRGSNRRALALRVHALNGPTAGNPYDILVNDYTSSWYVRVPAESSKFRVELGTLDEAGTFQPIVESNVASIPRMGISEETDLEFAEVSDEIYEQILHLSGGVQVSERLGSDHFLRSLQQRIMESLLGAPFSSAGLGGSGAVSSFSVGLSSGLFSGLYSSGALSSAGLSSAGLHLFPMPMAGGDQTVQRQRAQQDDFWLEAGVDVIVYGATAPDAKVRFMGQEIRLNPDGTFRFRMVFPDDTIEFPIEAESSNGKHRRAVKPVVTRRTEGDPREPR